MGILAGVLGGIASGLFGWLGSKKAAEVQGDSAAAAVAESARQFDRSREDMLPWLEDGRNALRELSDPNAFEASPEYNFLRKEGLRGIERTAAARGGAFSGNALRELTAFNNNLASGEYGNWWERRARRAGMGQGTATNLGNLGAQRAASIGSALMAGGDARASGIMGGVNALSGGLSNALDWWQYNRPQPQLGYVTPSSRKIMGY